MKKIYIFFNKTYKELIEYITKKPYTLFVMQKN